MSTPPRPGPSTTDGRGQGGPRVSQPLPRARDLGKQGIRVNLVAAGPLRTMAAKSIPGFKEFEEAWPEKAPLGWDLSDTEVAAKACVAADVRLVPRHHGRDRPRRRRRPRDGRLGHTRSRAPCAACAGGFVMPAAV
ncbi:SDR family oxidoreductase [Nonomuraea dietziae]|uniref:SDR family oxidoreductase n=1 Tax=Nonomuraea dietziae TaxID=65515 RepID=UPI0031DFFA32